MRTSYSALETYRRCPQKYKFQELDRIRVKKSKAMLFGTHVHACLKYMFSQDPLFPTLDQVLGRFRTDWPQGLGDSPEEKSLYRESGLRILKNFYAKNAPWNFSVVDVESRFEVLVEDPEKKETHVLAGIIDRIDKTASGYEIIDYKTSRRIPSQTDVDADLQLSIYSLGLQKRWPHVKPEEIVLSLFFLKHGEKISTKRTAEATKKTLESVLKTVRDIQKKIAAGERFEPVPGPECSTCAFKNICPAWRHLYQTARSPSPTDQEIQALVGEYFEIVKAEKETGKKLSEIKAKVKAYMEEQGYDRVFGRGGSISRSVQKRFRYDFEKIRAVLEPLGKWQEILSADDAKLKVISKSLPPEIQAEIENAKTLAREFIMIVASTKGVPAPDPEAPLSEGSATVSSRASIEITAISAAPSSVPGVQKTS